MITSESNSSNEELPVTFGTTTFNKVIVSVLLVLPAIGCIAIGIFILLGNDPNKFAVSIFMSCVGVVLILASASSITTVLEINPTTILYRNIFRSKTLQLHEIESINKLQTKNGPMLKIKTKDDYLLLGYLAFSKQQIEKIEEYLAMLRSNYSTDAVLSGKPTNRKMVPIALFLANGISWILVLLALREIIYRGDMSLGLFRNGTAKYVLAVALTSGILASLKIVRFFKNER